MRTKVLLGAAALLAAGALSAVAQNVYSLNVVGYYNLSLSPGFNLVANQLDLDGTGTNNTVTTVFGSSLPVSTIVSTWNPATSQFLSSLWNTNRNGSQTNWNNPTLALNPGEGAFVAIPANAGPQTITVVGQVLQGGLVNPYIKQGGGFSLLSSMVPLSGGLVSVLGYTPAIKDTIATYANGTFLQNIWNTNRNGSQTNWSQPPSSPSEPVLAIGQGFFLNSLTTPVWSNYFVVGP